MRFVNWPDLTIDLTIACAGEPERMSDATLMGLPKEIQDKIVGVDDPKCLGNRVLYHFRELNKEGAQQYREKVHEFALMRMEKVVDNDKAEADYFEWYATTIRHETWGEEDGETYEEAYCKLIKASHNFFQRIKSQYERLLEQKKFRACRLKLEKYAIGTMKRQMSLKRRFPFNPAKIGNLASPTWGNPHYVRCW